MKQSIIAFCFTTGLLGTSFTMLYTNKNAGKIKQPSLCEKSCLQNAPAHITPPVTLLPLVNIL